MTDPATFIATLHAGANEALSRGDLDRVMEVYADDVISMPADQPPLRRKAAVRAMWEGLLRDFTIGSSVSVEEISADAAGRHPFDRGGGPMTRRPSTPSFVSPRCCRRPRSAIQETLVGPRCWTGRTRCHLPSERGG